MADLINDIHYTLGEVNGKVDMLLAQGRIQDDRITKIAEYNATCTENMDARVRKVETRQAWYAGAATILGAVLSYFAQMIWKSHGGV